MELSCRFQGRKIALALPEDATLAALHDAVTTYAGLPSVPLPGGGN